MSQAPLSLCARRRLRAWFFRQVPVVTAINVHRILRCHEFVVLVDEAVHEARKSVKKARAVLSLVHHPLDGAYSKEVRRLRKAGRNRSLERDADVLVETFDRLRARYPSRLKGPAFTRVRRARA